MFPLANFYFIQHKERIGSLACPLAVTPPSRSRFLPVRHFCHPKRSVVHSSGKKIWTSGRGAFRSLPSPCPYYDSRVLFHRFHTGSVFSAIGSVSPALSSGFPNLILCCFCTTITPDDLSPRVSHPRDLILRSFSARKYRCFSVLPLTKSILIFPQPQLRRFRSLSNLSIPTFHQFQPVVISIILACFLLAYNTSLHYRCSFYG